MLEFETYIQRKMMYIVKISHWEILNKILFRVIEISWTKNSIIWDLWKNEQSIHHIRHLIFFNFDQMTSLLKSNIILSTGFTKYPRLKNRFRIFLQYRNRNSYNYFSILKQFLLVIYLVAVFKKEHILSI